MAFSKNTASILIADAQGHKTIIQDVSPNTTKLVHSYVNYCRSVKDSSWQTIEYNLYCLAYFIKYTEGKSLLKLTRKDMETIIEKVKSDPIKSGHYKVHVKAIVKDFYKHHVTNDEYYPPIVAWIKTGLKKKDKKPLTSSMFLNEEDIFELEKKIVDARDKAICLVLYESAARSGEFCKMRIKDVDLRSEPIKITITGKTGTRSLPLVISAPALKKHIEGMLASGHDRNEFLWQPKENWNGVKEKQGKENRLDKSGLRRVLQQICVKGGLAERGEGKHSEQGKVTSNERLINPHSWRKAGLTRAVSVLRLTEPELRLYAGWAKDSDMASEYIFLSGRDIDNAVMRGNGMKPSEEIEPASKLKPVVCRRCREPCSRGDMWCSKCGMILDATAAKIAEPLQAYGAVHGTDPDLVKEYIEHYVRGYLEALKNPKKNKINLGELKELGLNEA